MPVLLTSDCNCGMRCIAEENGFGFWSLSGDINAFMAHLDLLTPQSISHMGKNAHDFLLSSYTTDKAADIIEAMG